MQKSCYGPVIFLMQNLLFFPLYFEVKYGSDVILTVLMRFFI